MDLYKFIIGFTAIFGTMVGIFWRLMIRIEDLRSDINTVDQSKADKKYVDNTFARHDMHSIEYSHLMESLQRVEKKVDELKEKK